jgi:hypothetical protein
MDEYNGKKVFDVSFLDFSSLICRKRGQKLELNNKELINHILSQRCHNYIAKFGNTMVERSAKDGK